MIPPNTIALAAIAVTPVPPALLSTRTVWDTYPGLLTVTVKLSRRRFSTNTVGVTPFSPVESTTLAPGGSLCTFSFSWTPRVIVAHEHRKRAGTNRNRTRDKAFCIRRRVTAEIPVTSIKCGLRPTWFLYDFLQSAVNHSPIRSLPRAPTFSLFKMG